MRYYTSVDGYTIDTGSSPFTPQTPAPAVQPKAEASAVQPERQEPAPEAAAPRTSEASSAPWNYTTRQATHIDEAGYRDNTTRGTIATDNTDWKGVTRGVVKRRFPPQH